MITATLSALNGNACRSSIIRILCCFVPRSALQVTLKSATSAISFGQTDTTDVGAITRTLWIAPFSYAAPAMAIAVLVLPHPISNKRPKPLFVLAAIYFPPSLICYRLQLLELGAIHQLSVFQDVFSAYASDSLVFVVLILPAVISFVIFRILQPLVFSARGQRCPVQLLCDQCEIVAFVYHAAQGFHLVLRPFSGGGTARASY